MPEQVTFGATEEEGIAFANDGRWFVTSIGLSQSTVWLHDSRGERQVSSQGYGYRPVVSADGKTLTVTSTGTNAQGQKVNNHQVFEKS